MLLKYADTLGSAPVNIIHPALDRPVWSMKQRPTKPLPLPNPLEWTSSEARSKRAFSMPPVARTKYLAETVKRLPLKVEAWTTVTRVPSTSVSKCVTLAWR